MLQEVKSKPHTQDLESLFVLTILSLNLSAEPQKDSLLFFSRHFPYSFFPSDAIKAMRNMKISVDNGSTITTIKCGIHPDNCEYFLNKFMTAKLLHCPESRTRDSVKSSVLLQPTAKGFHFLERYCRKNGITSNNISQMLVSDYNSMQCIFLDRSDLNGEIIKSESIIKLLFQRFMGTSPNVYNASSPPDEITTKNLSRIYGQKVESSLHSPISLAFPMGDSDEPRVSPYAHRYFTHPDSESLTQYYTSSKGVRLYQDKEFSDEHRAKIITKYSFTGKAAIQWLMDCTDIIKPTDASTMANLFLKYKLIEPIGYEPSVSNTSANLITSRDAYYQLTSKGKSTIFWDRDHFFRPNNSDNSSSASVTSNEDNENDANSIDNLNTSSITLQTILEEPALCHLFREYLEENLCQENFLFYKDMERINNLYNKLSKLKKEVPSNAELIAKCSKSILSRIYAILGRYFSPRAPFGLNIDSRVKRMIIQEMTVEDIIKPNSANDNDDEDIILLVEKMGPLLEKARELVVKMMSQDSLQKFLRSARYLSAVRSC